MSGTTEWRREIDRWYVQSYVQSLRKVENAGRFHSLYGFHPLYAADKIEKMMHALDDAEDRYTITEAGRKALEGRK